MKEHGRNVAVGLTVIIAMLMLGAMILLFTGLPEMFQAGRVLRMTFPATGNVHEGDWVHLAGIRVGKVTGIAFVDGDPRKGIEFTARIDRDMQIPANVRPLIYSRGLGRAWVELAPGGPERLDPDTGEPLEFLPAAWDAPLTGAIESEGLIPRELREELSGAAKQISELAGNLNRLIAPPATASAPATGPAASAPASRPAEPALRGTLAKLERALDGMAAILGDPENQANLKQSLANLPKATAKAAEAMEALRAFAIDARETIVGARETVAKASKAATQFATLAEHADRNVEKLSAKLIEDAEKLSAVLTSINRTVTKVESGEGTLGHLVNDPKLYQGLLEASGQLTKLMKEFRELVEHWKKHGVPLKLAK